MTGTVGITSSRTGCLIIPNELYEDAEYTIFLPAGSTLMCSDCYVEDEYSYIDDGQITKLSDTIYFFNEDLEIYFYRNSLVPLTIIYGREICYADYYVQDNKALFNLPKGAKVNGTMVETAGEISINAAESYLIEY